MSEETHSPCEGDVGINLYGCWQVLVKRKLLILAMVAVAGGVSAAISSVMPKSYRVTASVSLGLVENVDEELVQLARTNDVVDLIQRGTLAKQAIESLALDEKAYASGLTKAITATADDRGEIVSIEYETSKPKVGVKILNVIVKQIKDVYGKRTEMHRNVLAARIQATQLETTMFEGERDSLSANINKYKQQIIETQKKASIDIAELKQMSIRIKKEIEGKDTHITQLVKTNTRVSDLISVLETNIKKLLDRNDALPKGDSTNDVLTRALFATSVQQSINESTRAYERLRVGQLSISQARDDVDALRREDDKANHKRERIAVERDGAVAVLNGLIAQDTVERDKRIPAKIGRAKREIARLTAVKNGIEDVKMIAGPSYLGIPVGGSRTQKVILAVLGALAVGVFLSLFLEWCDKQRACLNTQP